MLDLLLRIFGEALLVLDWQVVSDRARACFRVLFGLAGGVLCLGGGYVFVTEQAGAFGMAFLCACAVLFLALALFFFSIALNRGVKRAGVLVGLSFLGLFAARLLFGA